MPPDYDLRTASLDNLSAENFARSFRDRPRVPGQNNADGWRRTARPADDVDHHQKTNEDAKIYLHDCSHDCQIIQIVAGRHVARNLGGSQLRVDNRSFLDGSPTTPPLQNSSPHCFENAIAENKVWKAVGNRTTPARSSGSRPPIERLWHVGRPVSGGDAPGLRGILPPVASVVRSGWRPRRRSAVANTHSWRLRGSVFGGCLPGLRRQRYDIWPERSAFLTPREHCRRENAIDCGHRDGW